MYLENSTVSESPDLRALREKYAAILVLREAHGSPDEPDPRAALGALAARFPGALREIDELPLETIRTRIAALDGALGDATKIERWMIAQSLFHRLARGALAVKRWLVRKPGATSADVRRDGALDDEARAWADDVDAIARPPRGRVMDLVHARVARELGVTDEEARLLVFTSTASTRRRKARSGSREPS
jgi:hypothetical protein